MAEEEKKRAPRARNWIFTWNNHDMDELEVYDCFLQSEWVEGAVWQHEEGKEEGTPHLQGYVICTVPCTMSNMKRVLDSAHWEIRRGSHREAIEYCTKQDTRIDGPWWYPSEEEVQVMRRQGIIVAFMVNWLANHL